MGHLQGPAAISATSRYACQWSRAADLERWLGQVPHLGFAVEHGARWRLPGGTEWQDRCPAPEWKDKIRPILDHFVDQTPGSFIEEQTCALVWHYRTAESEFGEWLATELVSILDGMLAETELHVYRGKKIVEVRPIWANKGVFANELLTDYGDAEFILGIGDDRTDEDMFARLPADSWSVHAGADPAKPAIGFLTRGAFVSCFIVWQDII